MSSIVGSSPSDLVRKISLLDPRAVAAANAPPAGGGTKRVGGDEVRYIVQKYVEDPMLIGGRKFVMRSFVLIARCDPMLAFYNDGYARLALEAYTPGDTDGRFANLVSIRVQRQHADYSRRGRDMLLTFDQV